MNKLLQYEKYLYLIALIGFVIYLPVLFNGFVWDDIDYILHNAQVHQFNLLTLLGPGMFNSGPFYRPIPAIYFALLYGIAGQHAFLYHLVQITLHLASTSLLFLLLCRFFDKRLSFFLALVFLVHPINVESVAFIGSTTSELFFLSGIIAFLLATKSELSRQLLVVIGVLLLLSVLTKETGALYLFLVIAYRFLFKRNNLKTFFLLGIGIAIIYSVLRIALGGVTYNTAGFVQITTVPLWQRLLTIPAIITYYLQAFLFPLRLLIWQQWIIKTITVESFIFSLIVSVLFFSLLFFALFYFYKRDKQSPQVKQLKKHTVNIQPSFVPFLFFFLWFCLGIIMLLQIIPLDMTVADRWFYFPIVGLLGMAGVGLQVLLPVSLRRPKSYYYVGIFLLCLLSLRTFIRTFDWKDNLVLYGHDVHYEDTNYILLNAYARELFDQGEIDQAFLYEKKSVDLYPTMSNLNEFGNTLQKKKRYDEAIAVYKKSIALSKTKEYRTVKSISPYANIASVLLLENKPTEAISFITGEALKEFPDNPQFYMLLAFAESAAHHPQKALEAASQAHALAPDDQQITNTYLLLKNGIPIRWSQ